MNLLYIAPTAERNFSKTVKYYSKTPLLVKFQATRTALSGYCNNYFSQKTLMENDDLNRAYLIEIPFGVNLKTLSWILVYLLALCFAQFLTPYLVKLARHNVLKNVFTEILSGLPKPI